MSKRDRDTLLKLARLLGVVPYRKRVHVPAELLAGISKTLERIATKNSPLDVSSLPVNSQSILSM